jgi:hypothetical protein
MLWRESELYAILQDQKLDYLVYFFLSKILEYLLYVTNILL